VLRDPHGGSPLRLNTPRGLRRRLIVCRLTRARPAPDGAAAAPVRDDGPPSRVPKDDIGDRGNLRLAVTWCRKAADARDGDAHVALAYCYYYGLGTTKSTTRALRELDRADRTSDVTPYGHEEALYLRAVALIDGARRRDQRRALELLQLANRDGDYPEASERPPLPYPTRDWLTITLRFIAGEIFGADMRGQ